MKNKKTIVLLVLGILIVITLSVQVTYSYMKPRIIKDNEKLEIGINNCAKIILKDSESTINLTNMYPMDEEMGLQTKPYEFTISSTCEEYAGFNLYLLTYEENEISDNLIRYGITSKNDTLLETDLITKEARDITEEEQNEINKGVNKNYKKIYKVYSNNIPLKGESEYKLHIWIDSSAENVTMNKSIKLGVVVKSFDREETLAEYLIAHKDNTLIYHDEKCDYEGESNCELEAGDYSYRYSGASEEVNNYICFGADTCSETENYDNLYRIIGLFDDDEDGNYNLKLIKADYPTIVETGDVGTIKYPWGYISDYKGLKNNIYDITLVYSWPFGAKFSDTEIKSENLNKYYMETYLKSKDNKWDSMIIDHKWYVTSTNFDEILHSNAKQAFNNEIKDKNINEAENFKVGLMYASDFYYAVPSNFWNLQGVDAEGIYSEGDKIWTGNDYSLAMPNNWLFMGLYEWTMSFSETNCWIYTCTYIIRNCGQVTNLAASENTMRPTFYLNSNVKKILGEGTMSQPYIILQ